MTTAAIWAIAGLIALALEFFTGGMIMAAIGAAAITIAGFNQLGIEIGGTAALLAAAVLSVAYLFVLRKVFGNFGADEGEVDPNEYTRDGQNDQDNKAA